MYSKRPIEAWVAENVQRLSGEGGALMSCVQEAGDIAFVPKGVAHGVLNLMESVGYAIEFTWPHAPHYFALEMLLMAPGSGFGFTPAKPPLDWL